MKKLLSLVLVLMLVLSAFALAESGSVTGEWYADFYGSVYTLTLNEDGTYVLGPGRRSAGHWLRRRFLGLRLRRREPDHGPGRGSLHGLYP